MRVTHFTKHGCSRVLDDNRCQTRHPAKWLQRPWILDPCIATCIEPSAGKVVEQQEMGQAGLVMFSLAQAGVKKYPQSGL